MRAVDSAGQMRAVVEAALTAGINHLETAPAYGPAEVHLGGALRELAIPPQRLLLTSKLLPGVDLASGQAQLRASLQRLGVARLDNLAVHGLNRPEHLDWALKGDGAALLGWALAEGLVGQVGFSSHGSVALIERALASGRFGFCSLHLHLFDQERLPLARQALSAGIGVMAISPADKGGRLYDPPPELVEDCAPFAPLPLAYRFLLAAGVSTLTLGAAQPTDLGWAAALAGADGPVPRHWPAPTGRSPRRSRRPWRGWQRRASAGWEPQPVANAAPAFPARARCRFRHCCACAIWPSAMA